MAASKYETVVLPNMALIEKWAREGATDAEIAKRLGISRSTLALYKKQHPDISDTLKKTKAVVDAEVENALLRRALGYSYRETTKELRTVGEGKQELVVTRVVEKEVQPDILAQMYWLKNRDPAHWRDRPLPSPAEDEVRERARREKVNETLLSELLARGIGGVDSDGKL